MFVLMFNQQRGCTKPGVLCFDTTVISKLFYKKPIEMTQSAWKVYLIHWINSKLTCFANLFRQEEIKQQFHSSSVNFY